MPYIAKKLFLATVRCCIKMFENAKTRIRLRCIKRSLHLSQLSVFDNSSISTVLTMLPNERSPSCCSQVSFESRENMLNEFKETSAAFCTNNHK